MARKASKKKSKPMSKSKETGLVRRDKLAASIGVAVNPDEYLTEAVDGGDPEAYWEEIDELYHTVAKGLVDLSSAVNTLVSKKEMVDKLSPESKGRLNVLLKAFTKDVNAISASLKEVKSKHEKLRGKVESKEDLFTFVSYFQEYLRIKDVMADAIQPVYIEIAATFMETVPADEKLNESMKEAVVAAATSKMV